MNSFTGSDFLLPSGVDVTELLGLDFSDNSRQTRHSIWRMITERGWLDLPIPTGPLKAGVGLAHAAGPNPGGGGGAAPKGLIPGGG